MKAEGNALYKESKYEEARRQDAGRQAGREPGRQAGKQAGR